MMITSTSEGTTMSIQTRPRTLTPKALCSLTLSLLMLSAFVFAFVMIDSGAFDRRLQIPLWGEMKTIDTSTDTTTTAPPPNNNILKPALVLPVVPSLGNNSHLLSLYTDFHRSPTSLDEKSNFIKTVTSLLPAAQAKCQANLNRWLIDKEEGFRPSSFEVLKNSRGGANVCRGRSVLYSLTGIFVSALYMNDLSEWRAGSAYDVVLFPCYKSGDININQIKDTNEFHAITFQASLRASSSSGDAPPVHPNAKPSGLPPSSLLTPVVTPMTIDGINVQILTFYPAFAGKKNHFLDVRLRWFDDKNPSSASKMTYLGESETRSCSVQRCAFRAGTWGGRSCVQEVTVVKEAVVISDSNDETYNLKERIDELPLLVSGENHGLGTYFKLETTKDVQITLENCHNTNDKYTNSAEFCNLLSDEKYWGYSSFLRAHYYFQPETTRIKNYSPKHIAECFKARGLKKTLIVGDSQSRCFYGPLGNFYGGGMSREDILAIKELLKRGENTKVSTDNLGPEKMSIRYIQDWDSVFTRTDAMFNDAGLFKEGGPEVFIYNAGFAHNDLDAEIFLKWWLNKMKDPNNVIPKVRIFVGIVSLQGQRNQGWSLRNFAERNERYSVLMKLAGFAWLDLNALTVSMPVESTGEQDGFHYIDDVNKVGAMVMINMICNAPVESFEGNGAEKWYEIGDKLDIKQEQMTYYDYTLKKIKIRGEEMKKIPVFEFKNDTAREMSWKSGYNAIDYQKWKLFDEG